MFYTDGYFISSLSSTSQAEDKKHSSAETLTVLGNIKTRKFLYKSLLIIIKLQYILYGIVVRTIILWNNSILMKYFPIF